MPKVANGIDLVWKPWQVHAENFEYELRRGVIPHKAGTIRLLAYTNQANMGIYRDQVIQAGHAEDGGDAPEEWDAPRLAAFARRGNIPNSTLPSVPDITAHPWHITRKYGFGVNLEQDLTPHLTAFARFGWDNGKTESFAYTEVDQTFAEG